LQPIDNFTPIVATYRPCGAKTSKSVSELLKYRRFTLRAMLPVTILTMTYQSTTTPLPLLRHWQLELKYFRF